VKNVFGFIPASYNSPMVVAALQDAGWPNKFYHSLILIPSDDNPNFTIPFTMYGWHVSEMVVSFEGDKVMSYDMIIRELKENMSESQALQLAKDIQSQLEREGYIFHQENSYMATAFYKATCRRSGDIEITISANECSYVKIMDARSVEISVFLLKNLNL